MVCYDLYMRRCGPTRSTLPRQALGGVLLVIVCTAVASGDQGLEFVRLAGEYVGEIRPLVGRFCLDCHSTRRQRGELDLERFATLSDVRRQPRIWQQVLEMLSAGEMPPEKREQPSVADSERLRRWVRHYLDAEARASAGDPGPVVLRRLNNSEYAYTVRDLTGVPLDPAREFPADGAAGEGFTNTGNALGMSPALLRKYLDAGKKIAEHAVLLPDGFRFSVGASRRDWTDEILASIRSFYEELVASEDLGVGEIVGNVNVHGNTRLGRAGRLPLEKYFAATLLERDNLAAGVKGIAEVARERGLNGRYLATLWSSLSQPTPSLLLRQLRSRWRAAKPGQAEALAAEVVAWQKGLWVFGPVGLLGRKDGPVQWMEPAVPVVARQELRLPIPEVADDGNDFVFSLVVTDAGDGGDGDFVIWERPRWVAEGRPDILLRDLAASMGGAVGVTEAWFGEHPGGGAIDEASIYVQAPAVIEVSVPRALAGGYEFVTTALLDAARGAEGSVQPDLVVGVPEATPGLLPSQVVVQFSQVTQVFSEYRKVSFVRPVLVTEGGAAQARFREAFDVYHNLFPAALCYTQIVPVDEVLTLTLFYREDEHLSRLLLNDAQKAYLDRLWAELEFVSQSPFLHVDSLDLLLETLSGNGQEDQAQYEAILPLQGPYRDRAASFQKQLIAAQPQQLEALVSFATRAYRRPLTAQESQGVRSLYDELREQPMSHERAFRLVLARLFVAPDFLYRIEDRRALEEGVAHSPAAVPGDAPQGSHDTGEATGAVRAHPVTAHELANRLSYFLWSSMPDEELRSAADRGDLSKLSEVLVQSRRLLKDSRVRRLAIEFACQWLHLRDFDTLDEKSEEHFPGFRDLREDLYEESIQFFTDLFRNDGSILEILSADYTFLNEALATHYEIPGVVGTAWRRVGNVGRYSRGGILTQAAVLAKQSGASRSSPIVRGNFVFETLLGERLPRPPQDIPELPDVVPAGLTERMLVEQHTSDPACAKCHERIDPYGFALEGFDAVGRRRSTDTSGVAIDSQTVLKDGAKIAGHEGLRRYLLSQRRDDFLRQFCRKLLGYALGRAVQLSDEPLLDEMLAQLAENDYRFSVAVDTIVRSEPFRNIRGRR